MLKQITFATLLTFVAARPVLAAEKFRSSSAVEPASARYVVTLAAPTPVSSIAARAKALAATYGGTVESLSDTGFEITATPARARLLSSDARVSFVEERSMASTMLPVPEWQATGTMWDSGPYTYDGGGNVVSIGTDQYRYDGAARLVTATADTPSSENAQTFQYDAYGNLRRVDTKTTPSGGTETTVTTVMAVDENSNRLKEAPTSSDCRAGVICVSGTYDAAGNQTSMSLGGTYTWDALGNMLQVESYGRQERYVYDADNERIATIVPLGNGERRVFTLRGADARMVRELVDNVNSGTHQWSWTKDYVYRSGALLASASPGTAGEVIRHFHLDHLGTPRVITDARGYRLSIHTYWPFGAEAPGSETDGERMKFTGHERDFGAGPGEDLDYMHARYYTPVGARFLSVDPLFGDVQRPQMWNRYSYVLNNPTVLLDPSGKQAQSGMTITVEGEDPEKERKRREEEMREQARKAFELQMFILWLMHPADTASTPLLTVITDYPAVIKQTICMALPTGKLGGASLSFGAIGGAGGGGELVMNYNSGQVSAFGVGGFQAIGWNGVLSGSVYGGFIWGPLKDDNSNYSEGFTGLSGGAGIGGFASASSGGLNDLRHGSLVPNAPLMAGGMSAGASLIPGPTGGINITHYSKPQQLGKYWATGPVDALIMAAREKFCK